MNRLNLSQESVNLAKQELQQVLELGLIIMNKMNEVGSGIYFQSSLIFHRYFKKPFIVEQLSLGIKARNPNGYLLGLIL